MRRILDGYRRFLYGRYGHDKLNRFISFTALGLCVISFFVRSFVLTIVIFTLLILSLYRSLSKNHARRMRENMLYDRAAKPVRRFFKYWLARIKSYRTHKIYVCSNCHSILRVPKSAGKRSPNSGRGTSGSSGSSRASDTDKRRGVGGKPALRLEIKCPKCGETFTK